MKKAKVLKETGFAEIILYISLILAGTFHEFLSCAVSVALIVYLIFKTVKNGGFVFYRNMTAISLISIVAFYGISCFYAVDSGMALMGFFVQVLLLFLICNHIMGHPKLNQLFLVQWFYLFSLAEVLLGIWDIIIFQILMMAKN